MSGLRWSGSKEAMRQYQEACARLPPTKSQQKHAKKKRKRNRHKKDDAPIRQPFIPYVEYLLTPWWKQKRKQKIKSVGSKCEKCGATSLLQVHHLNYDRLGREHHSDLQVLCKPCHEKEHECWIEAKNHLDSIARTT